MQNHPQELTPEETAQLSKLCQKCQDLTSNWDSFDCKGSWLPTPGKTEIQVRNIRDIEEGISMDCDLCTTTFQMLGNARIEIIRRGNWKLEYFIEYYQLRILEYASAEERYPCGVVNYTLGLKSKISTYL
jgi:hypothetical protein